MTPNLIPPTFQGLAQGAWKFVTKTASWTPTAADSGTIFLVVGATANVAVTLPAINDGPFHFRIIHLSDVTLTVSSVVADTLYAYNGAGDSDSVAFSTSSELIGGEVEVFCDGNIIAALARVSSIYQTVTYAT
jgi:hypothetical protein